MCRAARRAGRCWCRRDRPTPAAALPHGMPTPCSPPIWRRRAAQAFYTDLKALVAAEGRPPDQVLILPGLSPMIASTEAEARHLAREVNELSDPEVGRK